MKKAQKEAAKAAKKSEGSAPRTTASGGKPSTEQSSSAAAGTTAAASAPAVSASGVDAVGAGNTVQFCAASLPTVAYAACSLAGVELNFVLGEVG